MKWDRLSSVFLVASRPCRDLLCCQRSVCCQGRFLPMLSLAVLALFPIRSKPGRSTPIKNSVSPGAWSSVWLTTWLSSQAVFGLEDVGTCFGTNLSETCYRVDVLCYPTPIHRLACTAPHTRSMPVFVRRRRRNHRLPPLFLSTRCIKNSLALFVPMFPSIIAFSLLFR